MSSPRGLGSATHDWPALCCCSCETNAHVPTSSLLLTGSSSLSPVDATANSAPVRTARNIRISLLRVLTIGCAEAKPLSRLICEYTDQYITDSKNHSSARFTFLISEELAVSTFEFAPNHPVPVRTQRLQQPLKRTRFTKLFLYPDQN